MLGRCQLGWVLMGYSRLPRDCFIEPFGVCLCCSRLCILVSKADEDDRLLELNKKMAGKVH